MRRTRPTFISRTAVRAAVAYLHGLLHAPSIRHCRQVHMQGPRVPMSPYYTPLEQALTGLGGLPIVHLRRIKELTMPATARDAFSHNGAASDSRNYCRRSYYHSDCHGPSRAETTVFRLCPPRYRRLTTGLPRRLRGRNALDCAAQGHPGLPSGAVADGPLFVRVLVDLQRTTKIHPVLPAAGVQDSA